MEAWINYKDGKSGMTAYSMLWNWVSEIRNDRECIYQCRMHSPPGLSAGLTTALNTAIPSSVTESLLLSSAGARKNFSVLNSLGGDTQT